MAPSGIIVPFPHIQHGVPKLFRARKENQTPTHTNYESNNIKHKTINAPQSLNKDTNFSIAADQKIGNYNKTHKKE